MRHWNVLVLGLAVACAEIPPSGDPMAPRPVGGASPATPAPGPEGYTFEADTPEDGSTEAVDVSPNRLAEAMGIEAGPLPSALPKPPPEPETAAPPAAPVPPADPFAAVQAINQWGVRVLSTVPEAQPPRAILGLADGSERVVKPGSLVEDAGIVVLAVGRDQVQVAIVKAEGDHAVVETQMLRSLFPGLPQVP
jgi:hypothetical protein